MALVRNTLEHELALTVGTIGPRAEANIDATLPYEQSLLFDGTLVIVDGTVPPADSEPFLNKPRRTFLGTEQPSALLPTDLWFKTDAGGTAIDVLEDDATAGLRSLGLVGSGTAADTLNVNRAPYDVLPQVTPTPCAIIQQALDTAAANVAAGAGPTTVYVGPGVYTDVLRKLPGQSGSTIAAALLWIDSGVTLDLDPRAVIKLANNATLPATCTSGHILTSTTPWLRTQAGGTIKRDFKILGGILDGNGSNQTDTAVCTSGLFLGFCERYAVVGTKVRGWYGTAGGPPGETFHFHARFCRDGDYIGCDADGSTATSTATGISASECDNLRFVACQGHDMSHGHGFTAYQCSNVAYTGCRAYNNVLGSGFNAEACSQTTYAACVSGGLSYSIYDGQEVADPFYGASTQTRLGNDYGWSVQGGQGVTIGDDCQGSYNLSYGVRVYNDAAFTPPAAPDDVYVGGTHLYTVAGSDRNVSVAASVVATTTFTADVTSGSATLSNVSVLTGAIRRGLSVRGVTLVTDPSNGIPRGTRIASYDSGAATATLTEVPTSSATGVTFSARPRVAVVATSSPDPQRVRSFSGVTPIWEFEDYSATSGVRFWLKGPGATQGNNFLRFILDTGGTPLAISGARQVVTEGRRRAYTQTSVNYTLQTQDDIVEATASGVAISLPTVAAAGTGASYTVIAPVGSATTLALGSDSANIDGAGSNITVAAGTSKTVVCTPSGDWRTI